MGPSGHNLSQICTCVTFEGYAKAKNLPIEIAKETKRLKNRKTRRDANIHPSMHRIFVSTWRAPYYEFTQPWRVWRERAIWDHRAGRGGPKPGIDAITRKSEWSWTGAHHRLTMVLCVKPIISCTPHSRPMKGEHTMRAKSKSVIEGELYF